MGDGIHESASQGGRGCQSKRYITLNVCEKHKKCKIYHPHFFNVICHIIIENRYFKFCPAVFSNGLSQHFGTSESVQRYVIIEGARSYATKCNKGGGGEVSKIPEKCVM